MPQPAGGTVSRPPTMADVARVAGVSHQTVSRVLSGHPHVRENTRADVLRAIEELGYRRNASARTLVTRRTQILGAVASESTLYGPASTLAALEEAARGAGYLLATVALRTQSVPSPSRRMLLQASAGNPSLPSRTVTRPRSTLHRAVPQPIHRAPSASAWMLRIVASPG